MNKRPEERDNNDEGTPGLNSAEQHIDTGLTSGGNVDPETLGASHDELDIYGAPVRDERAVVYDATPVDPAFAAEHAEKIRANVGDLLEAEDHTIEHTTGYSETAPRSHVSGGPHGFGPEDESVFIDKPKQDETDPSAKRGNEVD